MNKYSKLVKIGRKWTSYQIREI